MVTGGDEVLREHTHYQGEGEDEKYLDVLLDPFQFSFQKTVKERIKL